MGIVTVTAEAKIDPAEHLNEVSTEDLIYELVSRPGSVVGDYKQALDMLYGGRTREAIALLERTLYPKWYDTAACEAAYRKAMEEKAATPKARMPAARGAGGHAH